MEMTLIPNRPKALLVNPWVVDLAAYDLWSRPLGLLYLGALLEQRGWQVGLIDCMDRRHPSLAVAGGRDDGSGRGKYRRERFDVAQALSGSRRGVIGDLLSSLGRPFRRYGISDTAFDQDALAIGPPDLILVTTRMTYWYPGARQAIDRLRRLFPKALIALGGVYATLCQAHARQWSGADVVIEGEGENQVLKMADSIAPGRFDALPVDLDRLDDLPLPAWRIAHHRDAPAVLTSRGCPMRCAYCASSNLFPSHRRRDPGRVADEILRLVQDFGARDIAFYDDALLSERTRCFEPLLDLLIAAGAPARLHTPNGLNASLIDEALAVKMRRARATTLRLSLETANATHLKRLNRPADVDGFLRAMEALRHAGFERRQLGVYLLAALPGQEESEVRDSIDLVLDAGGVPLVGEYSPLPGTAEWPRAVAESGLPLDEAPLLQNNSVFHRLAPWSRDGVVDRLRRHARQKSASKNFFDAE
jgi:hypothetical protein